jgi:MFS family permease
MRAASDMFVGYQKNNQGGRVRRGPPSPAGPGREIMSETAITGDATGAVDFEKYIYRKVALRIIPILFLGYFVAYMDRVNVGFAKLQMLGDLNFSEAVYGVGAGIFFVGYFVFQVPSNLILQRVGARFWIAAVTVLWGLVSASTALVQTPVQFYIVRFFLGAAEAGFFPGAILYLTFWFPSRQRAKMTALLLAGNPVSGLLGSPLSGYIMHAFADDKILATWQWLFIIEAVPAAILGVVFYLYLDDGIKSAAWLNDSEKKFLAAEIESESGNKTQTTIRAMFASPRVWLMVVVNFGVVMGTSAVGFWLPTIIQGSGIKDPFYIGLLTMIPYTAAIITMILIGRNADRMRERRWHVAGPMIAAAIGFLLCTQIGTSTTLAIVGLAIATAGALTALPMFWVLPSTFLGGTAAAAGIAFINCAGSLSGFFGPAVLGILKNSTGNLAPGLILVAACLVGAAALVIAFVPAKLVNR